MNRGEKFCSLISRWDPNGVRSEISEKLAHLGKIDCPSTFKHNDDTLKEQFSDNKIEYLKQYRFNICPENSNAMGYTTEKIFESLRAGCIPIYYGSYGHPEPQIINQQSILLWDTHRDNSRVISIIEDLERNRSSYEDFVRQPRLVDGAEDVIIEHFLTLEKKTNGLISK